jgi:hypothetical protein
MATELNTFVTFDSFNNNHTMKTSLNGPKHVGENIVNKIHHKH